MTSQLSPTAKRNFRIDLAAGTLYSLFNVVINQFYIPMAIDAGATDIQVGILAAASAFGLFFAPLWTGLIEAGNPKTYTIFPNLLGRALILLPALWISPWVFVMTFLAYQFMMGIQSPAYASLMTRIYPAEYRGRLMGYTRVMMGLLMIPLASLVGVWSDKHGSGWPLAIASLAGVLSIMIFFGVRDLKRSPEAPKSPEPASSPAAAEDNAVSSRAKPRMSLREQWAYARQSKAIIVFLVATTFSGFGNIMSQPLYQIIQKDHLALSFSEIGMARTTYYAVLLVAYLVIGILIDKYDPAMVVLGSLFAYSIVPMLYGFSESFPVVLIGSGIQGIGDAIWDIGILAYVFRLAPGREATVFGLHLFLFGIRGTIGPLASTALSGTLSYPVMLLTASICGWIGVAVFCALTLSKRNGMHPRPN
jgi:MFS family permease